jgi:hypothetical protein
MPDIGGRLEPEGALLDVLAGWSAARIQHARSALHPIAPPVACRALIDTGAELTCADPTIVTRLGLGPRNLTIGNVPALGGLTYAMQYDIQLTVHHPTGKASEQLVIGDLIVMELSLRALGYDILIGRDVLTVCRFFYDGPGDNFRLSY